MPVGEMDEAVLTAIENVALTPEAVEAVIMSMQRNVGEKVARSLKKELAEVEKRIARMTDAIAAGGELASLVAKLRELEAKKDELIDELATQNCLTTGHDLRSDRPGLQGLNATILPHLYHSACHAIVLHSAASSICNFGEGGCLCRLPADC